jgi:hypothetical protein
LAEESNLRDGFAPVARLEGRWFSFRFLPLVPGDQKAFGVSLQHPNKTNVTTVLRFKTYPL